MESLKKPENESQDHPEKRAQYPRDQKNGGQKEIRPGEEHMEWCEDTDFQTMYSVK